MAQVNAQRAYIEMVENDYPGYRRVQVWVKPQWQKDDRLKKLASALADPKACYRLILASEKALYLFKPIKGQTALEPPVLVIPLSKDEIHAYRTQARVDSCDP